LRKSEPLPWPERDLAHDEVALGYFRQLCECCERAELQIIFARILTPELRRLDTWEQATKGLSPKQLTAISEQAAQFKASVEKLRGTVLVKRLTDTRKIARGDLLHPRTSLRCLVGVTRLRELVGEIEIGPQSKPDLHEDIAHLLKLVRDSCGQYHDEKLEQILAALGTPIRLKQYRSDRRKRSAERGKKRLL
jgi:hypothetical protein